MKLLKNRYKFEKILGQGGMGKVHLCTDTFTDQQVAIKECIPRGQHYKKIIERIRREYYFMTKIRHPNLVHATDFFQQGDYFFIVMEYVPGITLHEFIHNHKNSIDFNKQLKIAQQICNATSTLNENGIVHRDLKPTNIILTGENLTPKILDFGIAKSINKELVTITNPGALVGTPQYMVPEQIDSSLDIGKNNSIEFITSVNDCNDIWWCA